jgi:tetratricopeptide (TPR) repeat protein
MTRVERRGTATGADIETARQALASGDLDAAERLCRNMIAARPADAWPWTLRSEIALRLNQREAAVACAREAVRLDPRLLLAHVMHARSLLQQGDYAAALAAAEAAGGIETAPAEALDALGAVFGMLGRHHRALALFRRVVAARPDLPQFLFNLAATERMLGLLDSAEAHCDAAIACDRHYYLAHYLRSDLRAQTPSRNHIAEMEALIAGGARAPQGEVMLRFALGKEYEDLDEHARSFRHLKAGADLQRRRLAYDAAADIAAINRVLRTQTGSWLASAPPGFAAAEPIFVMGLPRSGTTVVERIIASHSAVVSAGETGSFPLQVGQALGEARRRATGPVSPAAAPDLDLEQLGRRYIDRVAAIAEPKAGRFIDKTLQNYLYCGLIHAALPKARIILLRRHPMDTCYALYKAHFHGTFSFSYDLTELAAYYLAFRRLAQHWRAVLPPSAFLEISYEDIVRDQRAQSRRLVEFLGLPWEEEVLRFHESRAPSATASAVQVRRPLYSASIGRWRHHAEALAPLREILARKLPAGELA